MRFETGLNARVHATGNRVPISLYPARVNSEEVRSYLDSSLKIPWRHFWTARGCERKENYFTADRSAPGNEYNSFRLSPRGLRRLPPPFQLAEYKNVPAKSNYIRGYSAGTYFVAAQETDLAYTHGVNRLAPAQKFSQGIPREEISCR